MFGGIVLGAAGALSVRVERERAEEKAVEALPAPEVSQERPVGDMIDIDDIHIIFSPDLVSIVSDPIAGMEGRITAMRRHLASDLGFVMPEVRITDDPALPDGRYTIKIHGVEAASGILQPRKILVLLQEGNALSNDLSGDDAAEPVYGAPARWIDPLDQELAASHGLPTITRIEVLATHLMETVQNNLDRLFTRRALRKLLDAFVSPSDPARGRANQQLLDEFIPDKVSLDVLRAVLGLLLAERVPVRNLLLILEAISEARLASSTTEQIVEHVRRRIGFVVTSPLIDETGVLPMIQLDPSWEVLFSNHHRQ